MKKINLLSVSLLTLAFFILPSYVSNDGSYKSEYSLYSGNGSGTVAPNGKSYNDTDNHGSGNWFSGRSYGEKDNNSWYKPRETRSTSQDGYFTQQRSYGFDTREGQGDRNTNNGRTPAGANPHTYPDSDQNGTSATHPRGCNGDFDMNLFEGKDEDELYSSYGFTRGDIYYIYRNKFDPNTISNFDGEIEKVVRVQYPDGDCYLVAIISTAQGEFLVNLGPVHFFDGQRVTIDEGDTLHIKGSKIRLNGRFVVIATQIDRDGKIIQLRNEQGQPLWRSGHGGSGPGTQYGQNGRGYSQNGNGYSQNGSGSSQNGSSYGQNVRPQTFGR